MTMTKAGTIAALLAGLAGDPAAAQDSRRAGPQGAPQGAPQVATDMRLEDAGFTMRRADTPERLARLRKLPPRQFLARGKGEQRYYLYADAELCRCLFVGDGKAMQAFRDMRAKLPRAGNVPGTGGGVEDVMIRDMDRDAFDFEPNDIFRAPF